MMRRAPRPMARSWRTVAWLAMAVGLAAHAQTGAPVPEQSPQISDCPPMPAPITVGAAVDVFVG